MALGSLKLPSVSYSFDNKGKAMVPVTTGAGNKTLGKLEIVSPMVQMSEFFAGIDKSLINLVSFAKKSFGLEEKKATKKKFADADTGGKPTKEGKSNMLESLKESLGGLGDAFGKVSIGEKLGAALLVGALLVFQSVQEALVVVLTPIVAAVKGLVKILGPKGTMLLFLGIFAAIKFAPLIKGALGVAKILGPGIWKGIGVAFKAVNFAVGGLLTGAKGILKSLIPMPGQTGLISKLFGKIKIGLMALRATLIPTVAQLAIPIAIAAAIGLVLVSIRNAFSVFKESLDSGDSMFTAVLKGLGEFFLTIVTLPGTLLIKLASWIAGLLNFDSFKEDLENFDFKSFIKDSFMSFITNFAKVIKAIAKGAGAALLALAPKGETPQGAFSRVYNEVMSGGEGEGKVEKVDSDKEPELKVTSLETKEEDNRSFLDKFVKGDKFKEDKEDNKIQGDTLATAKAAMTSDTVYKTTNTTFSNETNIMKEKIKELLKIQIEKMRIEKESKSAGAIMVNNTTQGDVYNQKKETNVSGELSTEHSDPTSRMINDAMMA